MDIFVEIILLIWGFIVVGVYGADTKIHPQTHPFFRKEDIDRMAVKGRPAITKLRAKGKIS